MPRISVGTFTIVLSYVLSQFYRVFLAVMSPVLGRELGVGPDDLALSSGLWFLAFALVQLPVGWGLDRFGPRRTVAALMAVGGAGGALIFGLATETWHLHVAMAFLGAGCAPALMGAYYIFAREYPVASFGPLAGFAVAVGSFGDILGAAPLVWAIQTVGWRGTQFGLSAITLMMALAILLLVRDPERLDTSGTRGSPVALLRIRALWFLVPLFFLIYAVPAALRGLWAAPYVSEVFGADDHAIGFVTLGMGLAMVLGNFLVAPLVRLAGSLRRAALGLTGVTVMVLALLVLFPAAGLIPAALLLGLIGFSGVGYALMMAHGRSFIPMPLLGRGVTFLNMIAIGGVAVMQFVTRPIYRLAESMLAPPAVFSVVFLTFLVPLAIGYLLYFMTPEPETP